MVAGVVPHPDNGIVPLYVGEAIIFMDDEGRQEVGAALLGDVLLGCPCCGSLQCWGWAAWLERWSGIDELAVEVHLPRGMDGRQGKLLELLEL